MIKNIFRPNFLFKDLKSVNLDLLKRQGIRNLIIDIDNTLVAYYEKKPTKYSLVFLNNLKKQGFNLILASNNTKKRVELFAKDLDIPYYYSSFKPLPFIYAKIKKKHNLIKKETVAVGDQILTDVIGANFFGFKSMYIEPIINKDSITTVINRKIEKMIRKIFKI